MKINVRKSEAIRFRKKGYSIRKIAERFNIPKSTLSGWFRDVELTKEQKKKLFKDWQNALVKARVKAVVWHNAQKQKRLEEAEQQARYVLSQLDVRNKNILELALSMLYLGEGFKSVEETGMGNSDPLVLRIFLFLLRKIYKVRNEVIRCQLNLRADQNPEKEKRYWAEELNLPVESFNFVYLDKRTRGSKTYANYHGVCSIRCSNVAIKRKLVNLGRMFCEETLRP